MRLPDTNADLGRLLRDLLAADHLIIDGRIYPIVEVENTSYDDGYATYGVVVAIDEEED